MAFEITKLTQYTPGEVSTDQAHRNYYYMAPEEEALDMAFPGYFDGAANVLDIGSIITCWCRCVNVFGPPDDTHTLGQLSFTVKGMYVDPEGVTRVIMNMGTECISKGDSRSAATRLAYVPRTKIFEGPITLENSATTNPSRNSFPGTLAAPLPDGAAYYNLTARTLMTCAPVIAPIDPPNNYVPYLIKPVPSVGGYRGECEIFWHGATAPGPGIVYTLWVTAWDMKIEEPL